MVQMIQLERNHTKQRAIQHAFKWNKSQFPPTAEAQRTANRLHRSIFFSDFISSPLLWTVFWPIRLCDYSCKNIAYLLTVLSFFPPCLCFFIYSVNLYDWISCCLENSMKSSRHVLRNAHKEYGPCRYPRTTTSCGFCILHMHAGNITGSHGCYNVPAVLMVQ